MKESRRHSRTLTFRTGTLTGTGVPEPIVCMVLNVSDTGMCLLVADPAVVPDTFTLRSDHDRAEHACEIVWRGRHRIGVRFAGGRGAASPADTATENGS